MKMGVFNEFKKFCIEKKAPFKQLLYFNHVRWLSMGQCLVRLMKMMKYVREFSVKHHHRHAGFFFSNVFLGKLAYLTDIHVLINDVNVYLQGENMTRPDAIDAILEFFFHL